VLANGLTPRKPSLRWPKVNPLIFRQGFKV
jgi:hypothetical protein